MENDNHLTRLREVNQSLLDPRSVLENPEFAIQLFEFSPDAIVIVDSDGTIRLVNQQAEFMFQYHRSEMVGQPVEMLIPEPVRKTHTQHRARYADEPRMRPMGIGLDLIALRKTGATFTVEINLGPISTRHGWFTIATIRRTKAVE